MRFSTHFFCLRFFDGRIFCLWLSRGRLSPTCGSRVWRLLLPTSIRIKKRPAGTDAVNGTRGVPLPPPDITPSTSACRFFFFLHLTWFSDPLPEKEEKRERERETCSRPLIQLRPFVAINFSNILVARPISTGRHPLWYYIYGIISIHRCAENNRCQSRQLKD